MRIRVVDLGCSVFMVLCFLVLATAHAQQPNTSQRIQYNNHSYSVYIMEGPHNNIHLCTRPGSGAYSFQTLKTDYEKQGRQLLFAVNGGMYDTEGKAIGLCISEGKQLHAINLKTGSNANFYLQPNGVFAVDSNGKAYVVKSAEYQKLKSVKLATQSGPMLVYNDTINPVFTEGSSNLHIRNAVGVTKEGNVVFIISDQPVNFYDLATVLRDTYNCPNALYLDGFVSRMYLPELGRTRLDDSGHLGPIIVVVD